MVDQTLPSTQAKYEVRVLFNVHLNFSFFPGWVGRIVLVLMLVWSWYSLYLFSHIHAGRMQFFRAVQLSRIAKCSSVAPVIPGATRSCTLPPVSRTTWRLELLWDLI